MGASILWAILIKVNFGEGDNSLYYWIKRVVHGSAMNECPYLLPLTVCSELRFILTANPLLGTIFQILRNILDHLLQCIIKRCL